MRRIDEIADDLAAFGSINDIDYDLAAEVVRLRAVVKETEEDCETWRKAGVKSEKRNSLNLKAFAAYIRDQQAYAITDEEVSEIIGHWVENEEAPL